MKQTCEYCDGFLQDTDEICPHCGATNVNYKRESNETPRTIEELKQWYVAHNLPPQEVTRFFIGVNCTEARAFGIYQDGERFIVYKNKDDGSRAVRYDGSDEAYAVNELYMKLKECISEQKANNRARNNRGPVRRKMSPKIPIWLIFIIIGIVCVFISELNSKDQGYYNYNGNQYYHLDGSWYLYNALSNSWNRTSVDDELDDNYEKYYESYNYNSDYGASDFEDTSYYSTWQESQSSSSSSDDSWDSSSSWDSSDSWDSGGGDWSSDW